MSAARGKKSGASTLLRAFVLIVVVLYAGYFVRASMDDGHNWVAHLVVGGILAAWSVLVAWIAKLVWSSNLNALVRSLVTAGIVYHALFGVAMLATRMVSSVSRNDDFVMRAWPHLVRAINSFE